MSKGNGLVWLVADRMKCTLQDPRFKDPDQVVFEAVRAGVTRLGCAGTQESDWQQVRCPSSQENVELYALL